MYHKTDINKCNLKGVKFFATPEWRQFVVDQIQKSDLAKLRVQLLDSWVVETVVRQLKIGRIDKITIIILFKYKSKNYWDFCETATDIASRWNLTEIVVWDKLISQKSHNNQNLWLKNYTYLLIKEISLVHLLTHIVI